MEKPNLFERKYDKEYFFIQYDGTVDYDYEENARSDDGCFTVANYCTDRALMQQRAYHEILNRLLWRYSMEHDGDKIDWNNHYINKFYIRYEHDNNAVSIGFNSCYQNYGIVYFNTKEIAKNAIEEIIKPFMEAHPDFKF